MNALKATELDMGLMVQFESSSSVIDRYLNLINIAKYCVSRNLAESMMIVKYIKEYMHDYPDPNIKSILNVSKVINKKYYDIYDTLKPDNISECVGKYVNGDYEKCISLSNSIFAIDSTVFEIYICYVKSHTHLKKSLNNPFAEGSLSYDVMSALVDIYSLNENTQESIGRLLKLYVTLGNSDFAHQMIRYIIKFFKVSDMQKYTINNVVSSKYQLSLIDIIDIDANYEKNISDITKNYSDDILAFVKQALSSSLIISNETLNNDSHIASLALFKARYLVSTNDVDEALILLRTISASSIALYQKESCIFHLYNLYVSEHNITDSVKLVVDSYIYNSNLIRRLNLNTLKSKLIETKQIENIYSINDIYLLILLSIFEKERLLLKDEGLLHASFANYLNAIDIDKPSDILRYSDNIENKLLVYFLYNVCQLDVLDYLSYFDSTEDLENERINICQILRSIDIENNKRYDLEISAITQQMTIRKRIQQVDEGKIIVDTSDIVATNDTVWQLYNRYKALEDIGTNVIKLVDNTYFATLLTNIDTTKQDKPKIVFVRDPKYKLFKELFYDIRDRFVFSNEYGLDSNLSVRIRHGTLKGELRRPFSECRLLTTKNKESGVYYENSFWKKELESLEPEILEDVLQRLSLFSASIDEAISDVPSKWIQVKTENKDSEGIFDYTYNDTDIAPFYLKAINVPSLDILLEIVLAELWSRTEANLHKLRTKLNGELKETLILYLNDLEKNLRQLIGINEEYGVKSLFRNISTCRTNMQNDINSVIKWFTVSTNKSIIDFSMTELVDTCLQIVRKIYPTVFIDVSADITDNAIYPGVIFEPLVIVLLNLLDNACKYGNLSDNVEAELRISSDNNIKQIVMSNQIQEDTDLDELNYIVTNIKYNIETNNVADALRKEGKTGFYKIHNILSTILKCSRSSIDINIKANNTFEVILTIEL
jgi:hypothetical protein